MFENNPCLNCDCYDADREGCTMPSVDMFYACPLKAKETEFFMAMIPPTVTAQEHKVAVRNGKPVFYEPDELKDAKAKIIANLSGHTPTVPYSCGVRLITKWLFPKGKHRNGEYRTTKPDTDNLQKLLKDCMTACNFWKDDALVCSEIIEKFWADIPGIYIRIEEINDGAVEG